MENKKTARNMHRFDTGFSRITGKIETSEEIDKRGKKSVKMDWTGGDTIGISKTFLEDVDSKYVFIWDGILHIGDYLSKIVAYYPANETFIVQKYCPKVGG